MIKIRLSLVLFVYGTLVIIGLVALCMVFTLMNHYSTWGMARELLVTIMGHNVKFLKKNFMSYERLTRKTAADLLLFNFSAKKSSSDAISRENLLNWNVLSLMLLPYTHVIDISEMWQSDSPKDSIHGDSEIYWHISSCQKNSSACYYYSPHDNFTYYAKGWRPQQNPSDGIFSSKPGLEHHHSRKIKFLKSINHSVPAEGLWSPMYVDFVSDSSVSTRTCGGRNALFSMSYYFCLDGISDSSLAFRDFSFIQMPGQTRTFTASRNTSVKKCKRLVVSTVEGIHLGAEGGLGASDSSKSFILSLKKRDETGGLCEPHSMILEAKHNFLKQCMVNYDQNAEEYSNPKFKCDHKLEIGDQYITMAERVASPTGIRLVLVNVIKRDHFFSLVDKSKRISIIVSILVTVGLILMCTLLHLAICVPIHWICHGMHEASRLSSDEDPMLKKAARYTIISEVAQLFLAYLHLRNALRELKAFVPQGLFIASSSKHQSDSPMLALFGNDEHTKTELDGSMLSSPVSALSDDDKTDFGRDSNAPFGERNGGFGKDPTPREGAGQDYDHNALLLLNGFGPTTKRDNPGLAGDAVYYRPYTDANASPANAAESKGFQFNDFNANDNSITQMLPTSKKPRHASEGNSQGGKAHKAACKTANHICDYPQHSSRAVGNAKQNREDKAFGATAAELGRPLQKEFSDKQSYATQEVASSRKSTQETTKCREKGPVLLTCMKSDTKSETRASRSMYAEKVSLEEEYGVSSSTTPSLHLNIFEALQCNRFRLVSCSFIMLSCSYRYINTDRMEREVAILMDVLVREVLLSGGVLEVYRPDFILISFGAHFTLNRHEQLALVCAAKLMGQIPSEHRMQTRVLVDSGVMYVGNCGAHGRTARVVFGDRLNLAVKFMQYELGRGRVLLTDRIAVSLPANFVAPVDHIIPLSSHAQSVQLFQLLNPALCKDSQYIEGAVQFRRAFASAINGEYAKALSIMKESTFYDPEVCSYFIKALECLTSSKPHRPRYCRFQLPVFEPLGTLLKDQAAKYMYQKLSLDKIRVPAMHDTSQIIGFGFESISSLNSLFKDGGYVPNTLEHTRHTLPNVDQSPSVAAGDSTKPGKSDHSKTGSDSKRRGLSFSLMNTPEESTLEAIPRTVVDCTGTVWHLLPDPIDAGAFAEVYKAISHSGTIMALKCINLVSHHVQLQDVVQEVNTACKLFNEYIVNYTSWAHVGPYLIIIMDYIAGGSLQWVLASFPRGMPVRLVKRYASDALKGLGYLHDHNIVHADLKPGNLLISTDGGCKLGDFGSSVHKHATAVKKASQDNLTEMEDERDGVFALRGTARYMSPEVARGATPTAHSDVWSFGVTLCEMLTGRLPWAWRKEDSTTLGTHLDPTGGRGGMTSSLTKRRTSTAKSRASIAGFFFDHLDQVHNFTDVCFIDEGPNNRGSLQSDALLTPTRLRAKKHQTNVSEKLSTHLFSPVVVRVSEGGDDHNDGSSLARRKEGGTPTLGPQTNQGKSTAGTPQGGSLRRDSGTPPCSSSGGFAHNSASVNDIPDARFVQGLANGTIEVQLQSDDFPSAEAFSLVSSCLQVDPKQRPSTAELLGHAFFII